MTIKEPMKFYIPFKEIGHIMTIKELIEKLMEFDSSLVVKIISAENGQDEYDIEDIEKRDDKLLIF